jgi:hypothetical protein
MKPDARALQTRAARVARADSPLRRRPSGGRRLSPAISLCIAVALLHHRETFAAVPDDWFSPKRVTVTVSAPPAKDFSKVEMALTNAEDARIEISGVSDGKPYAGSLMVVSGTRLLAKGVPVQAGAEIDVVDAPVLQVRLASELLVRAFPGGPGTITAAKAVNLTEQKESIRINTQSAEGGYPAPWSLTGTAKPDGSAKTFDLVFRCTGMKDAMRIAGTWTASGPALELPDSMPLAGWRVFSLGPYSKQDGRGTIFDYGAQEIPGGFANLGDVRRDVANHKK